MIPRRFKCGVCRFPYGGNGSLQSESPKVGDWLAGFTLEVHKDPRCEPTLFKYTEADTPLTMTRNGALKAALDKGVDVLVMIDSDTVPDLYLGFDPLAKPFWKSSFDFFVEHYDRGPCIVYCPYCGPPPHPIMGGEEIPYAFHWSNAGNTRQQKEAVELKIFSRTEAAERVGFECLPAGCTGLILIDMRAIGHPVPEEGTPAWQDWGRKCEKQGWHPLPPPWFDYEWADSPYNTIKASTEDVYFTRNATLAGTKVYCNWWAWCGHAKIEIVGKPILPTVEGINKDYVKAVLAKNSEKVRLVELHPEKSAEEVMAEVQAAVAKQREAMKAETLQPPAMLSPKEIENTLNRPRPVRSAAEAMAAQQMQSPPCDPEEQTLLNRLRKDFGSLKQFSAEYDRLAEESADPTVPPVWEEGGRTFIGHVTCQEDLDVLAGLVREIDAKRIVEVGSWLGQSALAMAEAAPDAIIRCVDTWEGSVSDMTGPWARNYGPDSLYRAFCQNVGDRLNRTILPHRNQSLTVAQALTALRPGDLALFDLIFIDADHSYESVKADILAWAPLVRKGGILCGHDYGMSFLPGVERAVDESFPRTCLKTKGAIWWVTMDGEGHILRTNGNHNGRATAGTDVSASENGAGVSVSSGT
jgi:predicted O-methyltransferase YrrM